MPRIFDNLNESLAPALRQTLQPAQRADFCVGYFNLRGWQEVDEIIEAWPGGEGRCVRLLIGMQQPPDQELRDALALNAPERMALGTAQRLRTRMVQRFREQLTWGAPTNRTEVALQRLARQLRARKVIVKLYLRAPLHAKLYLVHRQDYGNPMTAFVGSSNLTFSGLQHQGELNVDVLDHDATQKLAAWFEARWEDRFCLDITEELAEIIEQSWARETLVPPYHVYLKMVYHLAQEARAGLNEFRVPRDLATRLFPYQAAAVRIAARHLHQRNGVLLGDVVGLGKTLMATALARIFKDDFGTRILILCPKNLVRMWQQYSDDYDLEARVMPLTRVQTELRGDIRRYHLVIVDESHNLRNPEGKRYAAIRDYIESNDSRVILLSATPYNKSYLDLSAQLRLFLSPTQPLGIRPEQLIREMGARQFAILHQGVPDTLLAFEKSPYPDDWRELMRLFMVRRTRGFIKENYARIETETGRRYLEFADGSRSYFPLRQPRTLHFDLDSADAHDQYAHLYDTPVVELINGLRLPRYGLGQYLSQRAAKAASPAEAKLLDGLGRAGQRLIGFSRTNLFKRLESSGAAFYLSLHRHLLRNFVFLHALEQGLDLPLGTQEAELLDTLVEDEEVEALIGVAQEEEEGREEANDIDTSVKEVAAGAFFSAELYRQRAAAIYELYRHSYPRRFRWLPPRLLNRKRLQDDLSHDSVALLTLCQQQGAWQPQRDRKVAALLHLLTVLHPTEKVVVFSQFADSVRYLESELTARGVDAFAAVTGQSADPTALARRFSPRSNGATLAPGEELRVLLTTDVLSEGQNLQDCAIVVNYDLPWAIIRLIQRAGRVDRIGQRAERILVYSFLPADGIERIIRLRARVQERLTQSGEVLGTDEAFFEEAAPARVLHDLYTENAQVLDEEEDQEVDLASYAYQVWQNATEADPSLAKRIEGLAHVTFATRHIEPLPGFPEGVLLYVRSSSGVDSLAWLDETGQPYSQSQFAILRAAACAPDTPPQPRHPAHHDLVAAGVSYLLEEGQQPLGGQLGRPSSARARTFQRLQHYLDWLRGTLFGTPERVDLLERTADEVFRYPLQQGATDTLNRQLRSGINDEALVELVLRLRDENRLCLIPDEDTPLEAQIVCSMGLFGSGDG